MKKGFDPFGKCFGVATMGERGQVVIPVEARKELDLETGAKFLVYSGMGGSGVFLVKADVLGEFIRGAVERLDEIGRTLNETNSDSVA